MFQFLYNGERRPPIQHQHTPTAAVRDCCGAVSTRHTYIYGMYALGHKVPF